MSITPHQWFEEEQIKLQMIVAQDLTAEDYYEAGHFSTWLLAIADGIRACQAYCISSAGTMVLLVNDKDDAD